MIYSAVILITRKMKFVSDEKCGNQIKVNYEQLHEIRFQIIRTLFEV